MIPHAGKISLGLSAAAFLANDEGYPRTALGLLVTAAAVFVFGRNDDDEPPTTAPETSVRPQARPF